MLLYSLLISLVLLCKLLVPSVNSMADQTCICPPQKTRTIVLGQSLVYIHESFLPIPSIVPLFLPLELLLVDNLSFTPSTKAKYHRTLI